MRDRLSALAIAALALLITLTWASRGESASEVFVVKPYLQLGNAPHSSGRERFDLCWQTDDTPHGFAVQVRPGSIDPWRDPIAARVERIARPQVATALAYRVTLDRLPPGEIFHYRVLRDGVEVFSAVAMARRRAGEPTHFVVFGDCGQNTPGERAIVYQTAKLHPDFLFILGDVVYLNGRFSEYLSNYFPFFNADRAAVDVGAPLLRSTLTLASTGNHDTNFARENWAGNFTKFPDGMAWYLLFCQPLNGPTDKYPADLQGDLDRKKAFVEAAGARWPRMANYSFDYGNTHWTVLDSNPNVDWTDPSLRAWVARDIASSHARWHIVAFHHTAFHSSIKHAKEQQMRVLSDVFQAAGVDIVFSGHVHNYERTRPLRFTPKRQPDGKWRAADGVVAGDFQIDRKYDGMRNPHPDGIIYITSGAGGATLQDPMRQTQPADWQPYTVHMDTEVHSLTAVETDDHSMRCRQIDAQGRELDRFAITK